MDLKDTKILIPEIPVEWEHRTRSGHINTWNKDSDDPNRPETKLEPPMQGLYAERFADGWYWVCDCNICLQNNNPYSYIVCYEHNRCATCHTHRENLSGIAWATPNGFQCQSCHEKEHEAEKQKAIAIAKENNHDKWDCFREDDVICPQCATEHETEEPYESGTHEIKCHVCDLTFELEVDYEPKYTTNFKNETEE